MNEIRCLVISSSIDYSTDYVCLELEARGAPYFRINRDQLLEYKITLDVDREAMAFEVAGGPTPSAMQWATRYSFAPRLF